MIILILYNRHPYSTADSSREKAGGGAGGTSISSPSSSSPSPSSAAAAEDKESWASKISRFSSSEPPPAKEIIESLSLGVAEAEAGAGAGGNPNEEYKHYAHEALNGHALSYLINSTSRAIAYPPVRMVADDIRNETSVMTFTLRQSALLLLLASRRNNTMNSIFGGDGGAPVAFRVASELAHYHDAATSTRKPANSNGNGGTWK